MLATRAFLNWMVSNRRMAANPLAILQLHSTKTDIRHQRRELSASQVLDLLEVTRTSIRTFRTLTGEDRYFLDLVALTVGFRASALASLTPENFTLDTTPPTVTLAAINNKSSTVKVVPLTSAVAVQLRRYLATKPVNQPVWGGTWAPT